MSEVFEGYERQYCELSANLSRKCNSTSLLPRWRFGKWTSRRGVCRPNVKAMLLAKLREYKSDLNKLKREFKRITSGDVNQASRVELFGSWDG
ncbi:hypothetical protein NC653_026647 [Populus alba x Populus x berolinensis]|uniref:Vesicle transport v-SNARE N-terminal domain-containing protein n=1 Tax=Populus alba x Populus x berolinensis TaxID=444605 RepID=A0AAD6Q977_9ROSI|nr:hypothetical protein NC653_026647 [Populus alba x Populus x berolinensis]